MRKGPSLTKRCEKSGKDAKRAKFHETTGTAINYDAFGEKITL